MPVAVVKVWAANKEQTPLGLMPRSNYDDDLIDRRALDTPKEAERSIPNLASYFLIFAKSEREKARAIYRWIAQNIRYDVGGYTSGHYGDLSPEGVLSRRSAVCDGYAGLFSSLAGAMHLNVVKISGYAKGYGYSVGSSFSGAANHAWNAVRIGGEWHLLDSTWGAGYLDDRKQYAPRFEEHYFLTPPTEFIYGHYPEDLKWQLLSNPISKADYERLVYVQAAFFKNKLEIVTHPQGVIRTSAPVITIILRARGDTSLHTELKRVGGSPTESTTKIEEYGARCEIHLNLPGPGDYLLRVYAKPRLAPGPFEWALDYKIEVNADQKEGGRAKKRGWWEFWR
jgi:hypothetical protein